MYIEEEFKEKVDLFARHPIVNKCLSNKDFDSY